MCVKAYNVYDSNLGVKANKGGLSPEISKTDTTSGGLIFILKIADHLP
jgi:hypothetical protein